MTRRNRRGGAFDFFTKKSEPEQPLLQPVPDQVPTDAQGPANASSGNSTVDEKVNDILGLTGYHMRAIINAISVCNSTMKMQNNAAGVGNAVLNSFGRGNESKLEMSKCGSQCIARSETVKAALKKLLEVAGETPVLGYIASRTSAINSASYVGNSLASGVSKFGNFISTPKSVPPETQQMPPQPTPEPQPMPQVAGRRRTRRRR